MYVDDQERDYANLTMNGALFVDNIASQDGGGLYVVNSPQGTLNGVSFLYNEATAGNGGGMFLLNSAGYAAIQHRFRQQRGNIRRRHVRRIFRSH